MECERVEKREVCKEFSSSVEIEIAGIVQEGGSGESTWGKRVARRREASPRHFFLYIYRP